MMNQRIDKICIVGLGGVGGYFGAKITDPGNEKARRGYESYFIARGDHLAAIQSGGLRLESPTGDIVGIPTLATSDINAIPDPDLILLCVKSYHLDLAVQLIKAKVRTNTLIIPLLNGADIYDRIRKQLDSAIVFPASVFVGTHIKEAGVISQNGGDGKILFGADPRFPDFQPDNLFRALDDFGIQYQWNKDPFPSIWTKFIFIAAFGLVTAYAEKCLGEVMADAEMKKNTRDIMSEIYQIASAKGIQLPESIIEDSLAKADQFPYDTKTSFQRDIETKGAINEGDLFGGTIIREGHALSVPVPATTTIYEAIQKRLAR